MAKKTNAAEQVRSLLDKLPAAQAAGDNPPLIQEAKPRQRPGRKMRRQEGVRYVRISPALPEDLKIALDVAIKSRFRDTYPTIDTFIEQAVREMLAKQP